jgi:hypothetical protein
MRKSSFDTGGQTALTQELSNWSAKRRAERSKAVTEQSYQEGLKEGMGAKTIERKKPLFGFIGADAAEAHNKGLEAAYLAGIDSDNISRINEIAMKNEGNVKGYDAEIEGLMSGLQKEVDPELSQTIMFSARQMADRQRLRIQEQSFKKQQQEVKAGLNKSRTSYYDSAARNARNGNIETSAESLLKLDATLLKQLELGHINQAQYSELLRDAEREATEHTHFGNLERLSVDDAAKWLEENKKVPEGFTADEWDRFRGVAESIVVDKLRARKALEADRIKNDSQALNDLEVRVNTGDYTETLSDLESLYRNRQTDSKYVSLKSKIINKQKEAFAQAEQDAAVILRLGGDQSIVPDDAAINRVYDNTQSQLSVAQKVMFADRNKTVPSALKREVSMGLMSDDPKIIKNAISIMEGLSQVRGMDDQFSKQDRAFASQITRLIDFMPPEQAIERARKLTDPTNKPFFDAQLQRLKDDKTDYMDEAEDLLGWDDVDALSKPDIAKDYQGLVESFAGSGMEIDDAKKEAEKLIKNKWQEWQGQTIAYSPDNFYNINGSSEWVLDQAKRKVVADSFGEVSDVRLMSDKITASEAAKGSPSYLIKFKENGIWQWYSQDRFYPDRSPVIESIKKENIEEAEEMQDRAEKFKETAKLYISGDKTINVP